MWNYKRGYSSRAMLPARSNTRGNGPTDLESGESYPATDSPIRVCGIDCTQWLEWSGNI